MARSASASMVTHPTRARSLELSRQLLGWFDRERRDLPWRGTSDPYRIWLSEIMLQQTRVATVIPYWQRFVERFPTVRALADAPDDEVLSLWSGLGYYSRARALLAAARLVAQERAGLFPRTARELRELPGVGPYTAGAVASMAFGEQTPLVDGNVARVLARLFDVRDDVRSKTGAERIWALAGALVPADRPGDFNQSLMELGSTLCTPTSPQCYRCPVESACAARAAGTQASLPVLPSRKAPKRVALVALVARDHAGRVLLAKRPARGLFAGLWEPPMMASHDEARALAGRLGEGSPESRGSLEHVLSHRVLVVEALALDGAAGEAPVAPGYVAARWVEPGAGLGISTLASRLLELTAREAAAPADAPRSLPAAPPSRRR